MKKILAPLALLLVLSLLALCCLPGCAAAAEPKSASGEYGRGNICAFSDMEYSRPVEGALAGRIQAVADALDAGKSKGEVTALLDECYAEYYSFATMLALADIRSCQNTADGYYAAEYAWCSEEYHTLQQLMEELYSACAESGLSAALERDYFWEGFAEEYGGDNESLYSDESVELMRRESALISEYRALAAESVIELDGVSAPLEELLADADDEEYSRAMDAYYRKYNPELCQLFISLVEVRTELAACLGFDGYEQMQYEYYYERDYTPDQAGKYIEDIKSYILPLYLEVMGDEPYSDIDYGYLPEERLMAVLRSAAESMGGETAEAFAFMEDNGLYDVALRENKADMSFQTYLPDYEAPFLFADPYGDIEDVLTVAHEFGHYLDAYVNYDAYETIDLSECYSQAMELLVLSRLDGVLSGGEQRTLRAVKLLDMLETYVQQASFAEFETRVYAAAPGELTVESLNALSEQLARDYGYYEAGNGDYYALSWIDIVHFFEQPFYVISYPVSADVALQIFALELSHPGAGLERLQEMLSRQSEQLLSAVESAGLESPFSAGRVEQAASVIRRAWYERGL